MSDEQMDDRRRAEQHFAPTEEAKKLILSDPIMYSVYTQCVQAFVDGINDERKRKAVAGGGGMA